MANKRAKKDKLSAVGTASLKVKAQKVFNSWIRNRDKDKGCISCGAGVDQAGHFYSAGKFNALRFDEDNCHGQCLRCNYFLSGNLLNYREGLIKKIGKERFEKLEQKSNFRGAVKNDRFLYIEIIEKYKLINPK